MPLTALTPPAGTTSAAAITQTPTAPDPLRKAAEDFEAVFLSTIVARMMDSLPTDGPFGGGHAEATFRGFLAEEYAGSMTRAGGIGLADAVHSELLRIQETSTK